MEYTDKDGTKKNPYIIHRTSLGCYERTLALLIEKYAGAFPTWLAPVQAKILPINDAVLDYAKDIQAKLQAAGVRVELDDRNEKIGYKIREAQLEKVPYMFVIGEKEKEAGLVSVRSRKNGELGAKNADEVVSMIVAEIAQRTI
jgi:threonyl-tRNA synthetase